MAKYIVLKGRNIIVGKSGCEYTIFDAITLPDCLSEKALKDEMQSYVYEKLCEVDGKSLDSLDEAVWCRRRNIVGYDNKLLVSKVKVFDHDDGTFYGFLPLDQIKFGKEFFYISNL